MSEENRPGAPLRRPIFHILLALSHEPMHGLGIAAEVSRTSGGAIELGPGTLYRSLKEMLEWRLVDEIEAPAGADARRRYYKLSAEGLKTLTREAARLEGVIQVARARNVLPGSA